MKAIPDVATDFDRIASALAQAPAHPGLRGAERAVVRAVPSQARSCLEVGCGDGRLARAVAARGLPVLAIDVSSQMIALARANRTRAVDRVSRRRRHVGRVHRGHVRRGGLRERRAPPAHPRRRAPPCRPRRRRGTLIIQDVVTRDGLRALPLNLVAAISGRLARLRRASAAGRAVERLYDAHGRGEVYLRPNDVAGALAPFLPGVVVRHHLQWRYTATWHRGASA